MTPQRNVDNWGGHTCQGADGIWEIFEHLPQFAVNLNFSKK